MSYIHVYKHMNMNEHSQIKGLNSRTVLDLVYTFHMICFRIILYFSANQGRQL